MKTVNIHEAKTHLSRLIEDAARGQPFVIARAGKPLVKVTMIETEVPCRLGFLAGQADIPDDFDNMGSDPIRPDRLSRDAAAMIADPGNRLWFSAASIWEVAIKRALDRPDFRVDPGVLQAGLLANDYAELPIAGRHYLGVSGLPALHPDPFDRILIAQALAEGMMLLTANARIAAYPGPIQAV